MGEILDATDADDNGNTTAYGHDSLNRPAFVNFADGTSRSSTYDVHHNVATSTDAVGNVVANTYDLLNRMTNRTITLTPGTLGTSLQVLVYDGLSRLITAQDDDSLVTRVYDSLSRMVSDTQQILPLGTPQTVNSTYDAFGNLTDLIYPGGRALALSYDTLERVSLIEDAPAGPGPDIALYDYLGPYRVERRDYGNGTRYEPIYDGIRRLDATRHTHLTFGFSIDDRTYAYDPASNKAFDQDRNQVPPEFHFYQFDSVSSMKQSQRTTSLPDPRIDYLFDGVGNRTSINGGPDPGLYLMDA